MKEEFGMSQRSHTNAPASEVSSRRRLSRSRSAGTSLIVALMLILFCFAIAAGQTPTPTPIPPPCVSKPLVQPPDITPTDARIKSALVIRMKTWNWLVKDKTAGTPVPVAGTRPTLDVPPICSYRTQQKDKDNKPVVDKDGNPVLVTLTAQVFTTKLRTYGYPKDPAKWDDPVYLSKDENINWVIPGPTFHLKPGQGMDLSLYNALDPKGARLHNCDDPGAAPRNFDAYPNCFHGNNVTNMHFHGLRVSPRPPQDNIFLELYPAKDPNNPPKICVKDGNEADGCYQTSLDPIPDIQAIGTHWYHPHKHGATALQVMNGMVGALLVEGPYDRELNDAIGKVTKQPDVEPEQKLLVIQQLRSEVNFLNKVPGGFGGQFWVNGQRQPVIQMRPGEIQRWRFVGAIQQLGGFQALQFNTTKMRSRQIAQDGVPFHPKNYAKQPLNLISPNTVMDLSLLRNDGKNPFPPFPGGATAEQIEENAVYTIAPGTRVDLLVVAPKDKGIYVLDYTPVGQISPIPASVRDPQVLADVDANNLLLVEVTDNKTGGAICKDVDDCLQNITLPNLPDYLRDIDPEPQKKDKLTFQMNPGPPNTVNDAGSKVFIDNRLFNPGFIDHRVSLRQPEQWVVANTSGIPHPFHIHVNPFQLTKVMDKNLEAPWVWFDVFPIPIQKSGSTTIGSITIRQRFIGFTGKFVLHCHILGHEDRGMMQNVLVVP
ncbi:MAG TPA: multicopper oxidase domain-containing protein [Pyrinomonadaceae bacterium]